MNQETVTANRQQFCQVHLRQYVSLDSQIIILCPFYRNLSVFKIAPERTFGTESHLLFRAIASINSSCCVTVPLWLHLDITHHPPRLPTSRREYDVSSPPPTENTSVSEQVASDVSALPPFAP